MTINPAALKVHAAADDGAPVCSSLLLLTGAITTFDDSGVSCLSCLVELARPHRGPVCRVLEGAR